MGRALARTASDFWKGFRYPFRGIRFVYGVHPGLVAIWIWPIVITAVAHISVVWLSTAFHDDLLGLVWSRDAAQGWLVVVWWTLRLLLLVVMVVTGLYVVYTAAAVIVSPFNDLLSERVELRARELEPPSFSMSGLVKGLMLSLSLTITRFLVYWAILVPAFVLSLLLPGIGQLFYATFSWLVTAVFFSVDYTDWSLARRGMTIGARLGFLRRRWAVTLGFGGAVWLFMWIPVVSLFFMPGAVAGGTLMVLDLEREGAFEADPSLPASAALASSNDDDQDDP